MADQQAELSKWAQARGYFDQAQDYGKRAYDTSLKYGSAAYEQTKTIAGFFKMDGTGYILTLGIALAGIAALMNTYDALSRVGELQKSCADQDPLKSELDNKFWITLAVSAVVLLFGLVFAWFLRDKRSTGLTILTLSVILLGAFGILYAIQMKASVLDVGPKIWVSWIVFIGFVIAGIVYAWKRPKAIARGEFLVNLEL